MENIPKWTLTFQKTPRCFLLANAFYFISKVFSFSRYLNFHHDFLIMQRKLLDQKGKINFKIHDATNWLTNNCNTYIAQYITKYRRRDNKTRSVNRIQQEKYFSSKIMQKMRQGDQFQTARLQGNASGLQLSFN